MLEETNHPHKVLIENFIPQMPPERGRSYRSSESFSLIFLGRLSHEKGVLDFIEMAKRLPNLHFHIYGDGSQKEIVLNASQNMINLHYHGFCQDIHRVMDQAHLLVIPSLREGLPLVALEALSAGLPVLASQVGGLPKLLEDKLFLCQPRDIEEFVSKIRSIENDYKLVCEKIDSLKTRVRNTYSLEKWVKKTNEVYESF